MDLKWNPDRVSHPGSSADQETDLNWRGNPNPSPLIKDDGELLMDEHLSPRKLKVLAGVDDLQQVKSLEMRVDTREISLGNFGVHLPNLRELKLNNSLLESVSSDLEHTVKQAHSMWETEKLFMQEISKHCGIQFFNNYHDVALGIILIEQNWGDMLSYMNKDYSGDLGTSLSHLCILWMVRCGLSDLDGISSFSSLKELYIAYNNISDLSQLSWLDHLEVLDLEGNNIEDINQMQYLRLCCKLSHLTVEGNLICLKPNAESAEETDYNYRAEVKKLIPHLKYLDRIPASQTDLLSSKKMHEDSLIIKESIKEGGLARDISLLDPYLGAAAKQSGCDPKPPTTSKPGNAQWSSNVETRSDASLLHGSSPLPDPTVFPDKLFTEDDSSDLTHGVRQVICGNPAKALHARRQKLGPPAVSPLKPCGPRTGNPCESGGGRDLHQEKASPDLRAWREKDKGVYLQTVKELKGDELFCKQHIGLSKQKAERQIPPCSDLIDLTDRCLQTDQQEQTSQALKVNEDEACSLTDSSEDELREACDEDLIKKISLDSSCFSSLFLSSSGLSQAQEDAAFYYTKRYLFPFPPKSPSPASVMDVSSRLWKTRNHRGLKIPRQEEDRQHTQQCPSRAHEENSAQPLDKEPTLLGLHSMPAASGSQEQHQPVGCTSQQRLMAGPAAVGSSRIRPVMDKSPSRETNHEHPAACSSTRASQRFRPLNSIWPLTPRSILQSLPDKSTATKTSQNRSPQS